MKEGIVIDDSIKKLFDKSWNELISIIRNMTDEEIDSMISFTEIIQQRNTEILNYQLER